MCVYVRVCMCLFNISQIPLLSHTMNTHSFRSLILKSLFFKAPIWIYSLIFIASHPPSNETLFARNKCCQQHLLLSAHYIPWRNLQSCPWGLSLLCGVNRITEALFLSYFKHQQKEMREKRAWLFPDCTRYQGQWEPPQGSQWRTSAPVCTPGGSQISQLVSSVGRMPQLKHGSDKQILLPPLL